MPDAIEMARGGVLLKPAGEQVNSSKALHF
jgi:hypothetical protein